MNRTVLIHGIILVGVILVLMLVNAYMFKNVNECFANAVQLRSSFPVLKNGRKETTFELLQRLSLKSDPIGNVMCKFVTKKGFIKVSIESSPLNRCKNDPWRRCSLTYLEYPKQATTFTLKDLKRERIKHYTEDVISFYLSIDVDEFLDFGHLEGSNMPSLCRGFASFKKNTYSTTKFFLVPSASASEIKYVGNKFNAGGNDREIKTLSIAAWEHGGSLKDYFVSSDFPETTIEPEERQIFIVDQQASDESDSNIAPAPTPLTLTGTSPSPSPVYIPPQNSSSASEAETAAWASIKNANTQIDIVNRKVQIARNKIEDSLLAASNALSANNISRARESVVNAKTAATAAKTAANEAVAAANSAIAAANEAVQNANNTNKPQLKATASAALSKATDSKAPALAVQETATNTVSAAENTEANINGRPPAPRPAPSPSPAAGGGAIVTAPSPSPVTAPSPSPAAGGGPIVTAPSPSPVTAPSPSPAAGGGATVLGPGPAPVPGPGPAPVPGPGPANVPGPGPAPVPGPSPSRIPLPPGISSMFPGDWTKNCYAPASFDTTSSMLSASCEYVNKSNTYVYNQSSIDTSKCRAFNNTNGNLECENPLEPLYNEWKRVPNKTLDTVTNFAERLQLYLLTNYRVNYINAPTNEQKSILSKIGNNLDTTWAHVDTITDALPILVKLLQLLCGYNNNKCPSTDLFEEAITRVIKDKVRKYETKDPTVIKQSIGGSFYQSCDNLTMVKAPSPAPPLYLYGTCGEKRQVENEIDLSKCQYGHTNIQGNIECDGNILVRPTDISRFATIDANANCDSLMYKINEKELSGSCKDRNNYPITSTLNLTLCGDNTVANMNGQLSCHKYTSTKVYLKLGEREYNTINNGPYYEFLEGEGWSVTKDNVKTKVRPENVWMDANKELTVSNFAWYFGENGDVGNRIYKPDDNISTVILGPRTWVWLYEHADFKGRWIEYRNYSYNLNAVCNLDANNKLHNMNESNKELVVRAMINFQSIYSSNTIINQNRYTQGSTIRIYNNTNVIETEWNTEDSAGSMKFGKIPEAETI